MSNCCKLKSPLSDMELTALMQFRQLRPQEQIYIASTINTLVAEQPQTVEHATGNVIQFRARNK